MDEDKLKVALANREKQNATLVKNLTSMTEQTRTAKAEIKRLQEITRKYEEKTSKLKSVSWN